MLVDHQSAGMQSLREMTSIADMEALQEPRGTNSHIPKLVISHPAPLSSSWLKETRVVCQRVSLKFQLRSDAL